MNNETPQQNPWDAAYAPQSLWFIIRYEWYIWSPILLGIYLLVNGFYSNWTSVIWPNTQVPLILSGDGLVGAVFTQRHLEGNFFESVRMGYPFVAPLYEHPISFADRAMISIAGLFVPRWVDAYTWIYVLSYLPIFVTTYAVLRSWHVPIAWSIFGGLAFDMWSAHHERVYHIIFVWYFFVPLVCAYAWHLWRGEALLQKPYHWWTIALFLMIGLFNAYWTVMVSIVIGIAGLGGSLMRRSWQNLRISIMLVLVLAVGLVINYFPAWFHNYYDPTDVALTRKVEDSNTFALWLGAVFTPAPLYTAWGQVYNDYLTTQGISSEHDYNAFLASIGLVFLVVVLFNRLLGRAVNPFLLCLATISIGIMIFAMVGGLSLGLSLYVTSFVRGINRILFFLAFIGIAAAVWMISRWLDRLPASRRLIQWPLMLLMLSTIWFDSAVSQRLFNEMTWADRQQEWQDETAYYRAAQQLLGDEAAIYQLPAISFPEVDGEYRQTRCYLYSTMFCSHGTFHGRDAHQFFVVLQEEPMARQVDIAARLGFDAIEISRNLFADRHPNFEADLQRVLGRGPDLVSPDGQTALYTITPTGPRLPGRAIADVVAQSAFLQEDYARTQRADITIPIDFARPWWPGSVHSVSGMGEFTLAGRWNNAVQKRIVLRFTHDLPASFRLAVTGRAWNKAVGMPVVIDVGDVQSQMVFGHESSTQQVDIRDSQRTNTLVLVPPYQGRASERDFRHISLFIENISITPLP